MCRKFTHCLAKNLYYAKNRLTETHLLLKFMYLENDYLILKDKKDCILQIKKNSCKNCYISRKIIYSINKYLYWNEH